MSASNDFEHITALAWYEIRASGWVSMTGSVEFARYKTSAVAGAKLNSALAFSAKAKVGKVPRLTSSYTTQRTAAKLYVPLLFFKTPKYARSVQLVLNVTEN